MHLSPLTAPTNLRQTSATTDSVTFDRGAMLSLSYTLGGASSGGVDALSSCVTLEGLAANDATGNDHLKQRESANNDGNALEHGINVGSTPASEPGHATLGHRCPRAHNPRRCQT